MGQNLEKWDINNLDKLEEKSWKIGIPKNFVSNFEKLLTLVAIAIEKIDIHNMLYILLCIWKLSLGFPIFQDFSYNLSAL